MSWRAGKAESHGTRVMTDTGGSVAWVPTVSSSEKSHCASQEEAHRRAVLMAAAPELLEALEDAADQTRHPDYDWPLWLSQKVSAAIAKAKGGKK